MNSYVNPSDIPSNVEFDQLRNVWREALAQDADLRIKSVELQLLAEKHRYTYQHEWLGVPIIRLPDDVFLQQQIVNKLKPSAIIETGVARGGSLILSASLLEMNSLNVNVLGLDLLIMPHAKEAILNSRYARQVALWEGDSSSNDAHEVVSAYIDRNSPNEPVLLVLDSDHSESHVLNELTNFSDLLPAGSLVMVADTIIEEFPRDYYQNRPWNVGNNPMTAVRKFLAEDTRFSAADNWNRRALTSEFRDGILKKDRL
jgi:cephalosporin hydroxylase